MSRAANCSYNFDGNVVDEHDGSWYVTDADGDRIAGPFASAPYAATVRDRLDWVDDPSLTYES